MSLRDYAAAQLTNGRGWRARYDDAAAPLQKPGRHKPPPWSVREDRWATLAGHYSRLLDDLVEAIGGPAAVLELLDARARVAALTKPEISS